MLKIRIRLRESNFLRTVSGKLQKMAGDKEEEGHLSSAVSNQSYWPQMITRGCAPFPPDITNCNFHLFPDRNTEFCKRPKRWTAMGCTGRLQASTLLRFYAPTLPPLRAAVQKENGSCDGTRSLFLKRPRSSTLKLYFFSCCIFLSNNFDVSFFVTLTILVWYIHQDNMLY